LGAKTHKDKLPFIAPNVAKADITCKVVSPIIITKVRDMHFGTIILGVKGTIILPT
jgi:hypothetical protein